MAVKFLNGVGTTAFQLGTSATSGYVLTADAAGNGTWQAAPGAGGGASTTVANTWTAAQTFNAGDLLDKGTQVFNVLAYGATGNGTTDDTTAIQSAITAAAAVQGTVFFPANSYLTSSALNVPTGVRFTGAGKRKSIIKNNTG